MFDLFIYLNKTLKTIGTIKVNKTKIYKIQIDINDTFE